MFVIPSSPILCLYWTRSKRLKTNFCALIKKTLFFNFYKTWDATGQQLDKNLGVWKQIENGSPEQSLLNKMCVTYLAKDINTNAGK